MAATHRHTASDLNDQLLDEASSHNFFCLLERLHDLHGDDLETANAHAAEHQRIRLTVRAWAEATAN